MRRADDALMASTYYDVIVMFLRELAPGVGWSGPSDAVDY